MEITDLLSLDNIGRFFLIFIRMTGFFVTAPVFGRRDVPSLAKIGFSLLMAIIVYNAVSSANANNVMLGGYGENIYGYSLLVIKEMIVGLTLGFVSFAMFTGIYMAGQLIDMQIGFGIVNVLDPVSNIQVPITSNFYFILAMMTFLAFNGHYSLIKTLFDSYTYIPLGNLEFNENLLEIIIRLFGSVFILGFKIAAPITAAILITDIALGVISRAIPQFNVFIVGMPLKLAIGSAVLMLSIPMFIKILSELFNDINTEMINIIKGMITV